jgi:hypothetical protein
LDGLWIDVDVIDEPDGLAVRDADESRIGGGDAAAAPERISCGLPGLVMDLSGLAELTYSACGVWSPR